MFGLCDAGFISAEECVNVGIWLASPTLHIPTIVHRQREDDGFENCSFGLVGCGVAGEEIVKDSPEPTQTENPSGSS